MPILYNKFKLADKTNLTLSEALERINIDENDKLVVLSLMSQITYDGKWENINESTRKTMDLIWHAWRISCDSLEENCSLSKLFSYNGELHKMIKDLD